MTRGALGTRVRLKMPPTATLNERTIDLEALQVRAAIQPSTYDAEQLTVEVVASTGEEVARYHYEVGRFLESLAIDEKAIRLDRLNRGASVLDDHNRWSGVRDGVLGVTERAWIASGKLHVLVRLSSRTELEGFRQDVRSGIVRHVSLGYVVHKYEDRTGKDENRKRLRAIDWEPFELSFVAIPAEHQSSTRAAERVAPCLIETRNTMDPEEFGAGVATEQPTEQTRGAQPAPAAPAPTPAPAPRTPAPAPPAPTVDTRALQEAAAAAERTRVLEVQTRCAELGLSDEFRTRMIESGSAGADLQLAIQGEYIRQHRASDPLGDTVRPRTSVGDEQLGKQHRSFELAMVERMAPAGTLTTEELAEVGDARHLSLSDIGAELFRSRGVTVRRPELAERSLHSSSDFPNLLQSAGRRTLLAMYGATPPTWQPWARENADIPDFRTVERLRVGEVGKLEKVPEGGDYPETTFGESKEGYKIGKYGHIVSFAWEMFVNDDLGALRVALESEAVQIQELESDLVYDLLLSSPALADGNSIFHTSRKNTTDKVLGEAGLAELEELMLTQRTKAGKSGRELNLRPMFLIVPPRLKVAAQKLLTAVVATATGDVNVFANALRLIVEGRLNVNPTEWYLHADPRIMPSVEVGYLRGHRAPEFFQEQGFQKDAVRFKVRRVIGAKFLEFRGIAKSTGTV